MAIENQIPTGQLSSASPSPATSTSTVVNMSHTAINGTHFDGLNNPTPPRRPSYEDDDTDPARPRKRPATLATVELLSAECMAAEANSMSDDVNMVNGSTASLPTDASSETTMAGDENDQIDTNAQASADPTDPESPVDQDQQKTLKSDEIQLSPDTENSSPNIGGSDGADEESYKNNNYVISNDTRAADRTEVVHVVEDDAPMNQEPEYQTFETVILPTLQPHTYSETEGRAFFIPMYTKIGSDLRNTVSALKELYPCIALLSDADGPEKFSQIHNEGVHAWRYLPQVIGNALKRSPSLGLIYSTQPLRPISLTASKLLFQTFKAFFKVSLRMIEYDLSRIATTPASTPYRPFCTTFVGIASEICRLQPIALPQHYTEETREIIWEYWSDILNMVLDEPYGFESFRFFLENVLDRLPKETDLMECTRQLYRFPAAILKMTVDINNFGDAALKEKADAARVRVSQQTYEISFTTQKKLKCYIGDNFLESKEDFNSLVDFAAHLLHESIAVNPALIEQNSEFQVAVNLSSYPSEFYPLISDACFRMTIYDLALRKCKKLEVRLHALTTICNELLEVWKKRQMKREDPLLRCIALFIRTSGLVDYILGPHSHFQLIQKAGNVVGFLIVMGDFDRHFVEVVWQPIIAVKDQREVHATIGLLQELCHNMTLSNHYDSCNVLCDTPVNAWDDALMTYFDRVLAEIKQHGQQNGLSIELAPYNLLIRLFSVSFDILVSAPSAAFTNYLASKFDWLYSQLGELLLYGPQIEEKKNIISKCVTAMEQGSGYKATDLYILNAVLESFPTEATPVGMGPGISIGQEIIDIDLVGLLVRQTVLCVESQTTFESLYQDLHPIFKLLRLVMLNTPELIEESHASQFWSVLCGEGSRDPRVRNCSFGFFSDFLSQPASMEVTQSNTFMRTIFEQYFPEMRPELFVPSSLEFCKHAIVYFNQNLEINDDLELLKIDGINQVWRIITTAPQDEVANDAINYLVHFFADAEAPNYAGSNLLTKINCDLVDISIKELGQAAGCLGDAQSADASESDNTAIEQAGLKFRRSLLVLQELLELTPATGNVTQKAQSFEYPGLEEDLGEFFTIQFQGYAPKYTAAKCDITVPGSTSGKDFYSHLGAITGLQNFRVICAGRELFLADNETILSDIGLQDDSFMILQSRTTPVNLSGITTNEAVRAEVQKHSGELYQLLTLPEEYSEKIWRLIVRFPAPIDQYSEVKDSLVASPIELTTRYPFKLLYALAIIRAVLFGITISAMDPAEVDSLSDWTSKTLVSFDISSIRAIYSSTEVVHALLECLFLLISHTSALVPPVKPGYDTASLVKFLISLLREFQGSYTTESGKVGITAFRSLLAMSTQDPVGLAAILEDGQFPALLKAFLLEDFRDDLRKEICNSITIACNNACLADSTAELSSEEPSLPIDVALYLWKTLYDIIPHTLEFASQSLETFEATQEVFTLIAAYRETEINPAVHFSDWCTLLLKHKCQESIDGLMQDNVIYGLSNLMISCIPDGQYDSSWTTHENLARLLQEHFLFPPLSSKILKGPDDMDTGETSDAIVLTSDSRRHLNDLTTLVIQSEDELDNLVDFLKEVLDEASPGLPNMYSIDRARWLRSDAGHVGLRNLSNTCYLNSLLTQLFMNLPFREFILQTSAEVEPPTPLSTLKTVFANLQDSWQKAFEPKDFVATIRDYDGELIDVGIQMDVEEFYNLLCDRIESQITPAEAKKDFRDFFGGAFVQQVKSMECEHVSEREEPFSAIQCDIKGKKNLQESLKAYVEGETLNGDNKYSCTNCNRLVDAVKRTCLKQIPNQVIFHLKRFEFDLRTMNRSKINDAFEFPTRIDLHPYSIDAINRSEEDEPKTDEFELVGVLVHSGTAETGHYYSYIKDRVGKIVDGMPLWFEFNDAEVSTFDPSTIPLNCFGGPDTLPAKDGLLGHSYMKPYSAYMLFYERVSAQPEQPQPPVLVDPDQHQAIFDENEHALRRYCLFDTCHLEFVTKLMQRLQALNGGCCTEQHVLETKTLTLLLDTFEQVAIKIKDCEQTVDFLVVLGETVKACRSCCKTLLDWLQSRPDLLRSTLLRCITPKVRQEFGQLIIFALQNVDSFGGSAASVSTDWAEWVINECGDYFEYLCYHMRAWDDYFGFLRSLAELSTDVVVILINAGFLRRCLEILMIEFVPRTTKLRYGALARFVDKGRKMLHSGLLDFIGTLLDHCDLQNPVGEFDDDDDDEESRQYTEGEGIPISRRELQTLRYSLKKNGLYILYKPLDITASIRAVNRILKKLVSNEPGLGLLPDIVKALYATVAVDPAHLAEPALQAIIVFLENVRPAAEVRDMVRRIAQEVKTIGAHGGVEHLSFFKTAFVTRNPNFKAEFIANQVTEQAKIWAPPLLTYHDEAVRSATEEFLVRNLVGEIPQQSDRIRSHQKELLRDLATHSIAWIDNKFVRSRNPMRDESRLTNILRILQTCCEVIDDTEADQELKLKVENIRDSVDRLVIVEEDEPSDLANSDTASLTQEIDLLENDYSSN
ncbi:hypothetical protein H072_7963 [Dactylellina haptotyla CBS 200.50]|uniref:USP domain-containing protein n=1 Tax=Dactylellina haptotyla (strain CBS 200.50) TaxID=1284197 RepID=S8A5M8_DACHA|nr:hypothetical protein H072_7963 [Dactylellina haptotyla CBS 200.50]